MRQRDLRVGVAVAIVFGVLGLMAVDQSSILRSLNSFADTGNPAHIAVYNRDVPALEKLIANHTNINLPSSPHHWTPLHLAVNENNVNIVSILLASGANVNRKDIEGQTPLFDAIYASRKYSENTNLRKDNLSIIKLLLANGADPSVVNSSGETPMQICDKVGSHEAMSLLLLKKLETAH